MKNKKWILGESDREACTTLAAELKISMLLAKVLVARGFDTAEKARGVFSLSPTSLCDPFLLRDMDKAVAIIGKAIENKQQIIVYGDYDVDGITATTVLTHYLKSIGARCDFYIPNRLTQGYGLNKEALLHLKEGGADLVITVDCGITANEEALYAAEIGLGLIISDHHECKEALPAALAVIDPKRPDCDYPFKELAGVGVAFKLVCALSGDSGAMLARYADIVSIGTVADVMPLQLENRVIVTEGLKCMEKTENLGLKMLLREAGFDEKKVSASVISFVLAPRINAAGRLGNAALAAEMFLSLDSRRTSEIAAFLCQQNKERQVAEGEILKEALEKLKTEYRPEEDKLIILCGENWHNGVVGIVSSRISDKYNAPALLISFDGQVGKGSGRSIKGFNMFGALQHCKQYLDKFGGHELAAGITVSKEKMADFRAAMLDYAKIHLDEALLVPTIRVDALLDGADITMENILDIQRIEPFGMGNPQPVFCLEGMLVESVIPISSDKHIKAILSKDGKEFTAMLFGFGSDRCGFVQGSLIDVVFSLDINEFRGSRSVQLLLKDVKLSEREQAVDRVSFEDYRAYIAGALIYESAAERLLPQRSDLVAVWRHIISHAEEGRLSQSFASLARLISWESKRDINVGRLFVCLDVFSESGLLNYHVKQELLNISLQNFEGKADISGSVILSTLKSIRNGR